MHRVLGGAVIGRDSMAALMISGQSLFLFRHDSGLLLSAYHHLNGGLLDLGLGDGL